jgi:hypothetical protein
MRKDKGLNGDLDRLPMLTWIMFLKFLDDMEQIREEESALGGDPFQPAIEPPYRWRDWARKTTASLAMNSLPSSTTTRPRARTARAVLASSPISVACTGPKAATSVMSSPRRSEARSTG